MQKKKFFFFTFTWQESLWVQSIARIMKFLDSDFEMKREDKGEGSRWLTYMFTSTQHTVLKGLPRKRLITYHIPTLIPFCLWQQSNPLQSTWEKSPFWNQRPTVKALCKPLWLYHYKSAYRTTEWQIIFDIQMAPFKSSVLSLIILRWVPVQPNFIVSGVLSVCRDCSLHSSPVHAGGWR